MPGYGDHGSDLELIEGLCNRDERALALAYDQYGQIVYSLLLRITRNISLAEDLLVEVFFRLWTHAQVFCPDKGTLAIWILSIARNMAIDHLRSSDARFRKRLLPIEKLDLLCQFPSSNSASALVARVVVQVAFTNLTSDQRRILEMAYFEGFSQSEIAARLHEPLGTVKSRMRSALRSMRVAIQETKKSSVENG